ncbi:RAxF-45 family protein [Kurthia senegalensis]|nr:RAxF-45 family protein [Kurthia senegalensis]
MGKSAYMTCEKMDAALYLTRVITFKFDVNGIRMPFFNKQYQMKRS